MLSLDSLGCFVEAARHLNFRMAARSVALTPAALGQRIAQLEDQLGAPLFHRTTRKVVLSEAGLALLPYAHRALDAAKECERAGRGELGLPPLELTVGTRHELGMSWLVPMLPLLREEQPRLTVHLYFGSSVDLLNKVRSGEIDCAIGSMRTTDPKLDSIRLHTEEYVLVGQPVALKKNPLRRPEQAVNHTLIDTHADLPLFNYWRAAAGGGDSLQFARILRMGTIAAMRALVLQGEGVAVLPLYMVAADLKSKRLVRLFADVDLVSDYFKIIFRADDPHRAVYESLAHSMLKVPLA